MVPLLAIAADLEARDERVAAALARIEREQHAVEALRARAAATAELLVWLPQAVSENAYALHAAERERDAAAEMPGEPEEVEARLAAADALVVRRREHREALAQQGDELAAEAARIAAETGATGLDHAVEVLSHRRGALIVEHSNLVSARDSIVREASELLGSVLGDPLASTSVAGLRDRLARALP